METASDKDRRPYGDYGSSKLTHISASEKKVTGGRRLTDLQILQQIDSSEDPLGKSAMRKIDFRS